MEDSEHSDLALSSESVRALEAHKRQLDADVEAGRFKPGDRRTVVLPNGDRFQLGHPGHTRASEADAPKPHWWRRLLGQR